MEEPMRKTRRIATVVGVAAGAVAFLAPSASAAPTNWTISPSGANFTASAGTTTLTDDLGNQITCASSSASGALKSSPQTGNPATLATVTAAAFNTPCNGPLGSTWTVSTGTPSWNIKGTDYTPGGGDNGTGLVTGFLDNIVSVHLTGDTIIGSCEFDVSGSVDGTYHNPGPGGSNGKLKVADAGLHHLTISNKTGPACSIVGDTATFAGDYTVLSGSTSPVITGS
ncbi:hypothetical protein AB0M28_05370 [Streptomyces sp. NPDC051940]|uniref:hypothetical protein n=1 Tax=Streptomyces sp. NPDC051940 TaxID=3155675 RepID=UPI00343AC208